MGLLKFVLVGVAMLVVVAQGQDQSGDNRHFLHTPYGTVVGTKVPLHIHDRRPPSTFYSFKGIQYATAERWQVGKFVLCAKYTPIKYPAAN